MSFYVLAAGVFAVVASIAAHSKGRNSLGWFLAGLCIGPFALLVSALPNVPRAGQFKRCSCCGEVIREDAMVCRFCGREAAPAAAAQAAE